MHKPKGGEKIGVCLEEMLNLGALKEQSKIALVFNNIVLLFLLLLLLLLLL